MPNGMEAGLKDPISPRETLRSSTMSSACAAAKNQNSAGPTTLQWKFFEEKGLRSRQWDLAATVCS